MAVPGLRLRVSFETAVEPPLGERQRLGGVFARCVAGRALVESHHDVGADRPLGVDHAFGREEVLRAVDVRTEMAPLLAQLAAVGQRKDLKAARIGQHRPLPRREAVHAARLFENLRPRTQVEVVGVGQDDLGPGLVAHVAVEDALNGGGGSHGHENRRADHAVVGRELSRTCFGTGVGMSECKLHHVCQYAGAGGRSRAAAGRGRRHESSAHLRKRVRSGRPVRRRTGRFRRVGRCRCVVQRYEFLAVFVCRRKKLKNDVRESKPIGRSECLPPRRNPPRRTARLIFNSQSIAFALAYSYSLAVP